MAGSESGDPARRRWRLGLAAPALRLRGTLRFGWAAPSRSATTASHPRGARPPRAVPSIAGSRVPAPPRGGAPPPGPRPSYAVQFRSAPLCHPWRADRGRACADVQPSQHVCPSKAATPIRFLSRPRQGRTQCWLTASKRTEHTPLTTCSSGCRYSRRYAPRAHRITRVMLGETRPHRGDSPACCGSNVTASSSNTQPARVDDDDLAPIRRDRELMTVLCGSSGHSSPRPHAPPHIPPARHRRHIAQAMS